MFAYRLKLTFTRYCSCVLPYGVRALSARCPRIGITQSSRSEFRRRISEFRSEVRSAHLQRAALNLFLVLVPSLYPGTRVPEYVVEFLFLGLSLGFFSA